MADLLDRIVTELHARLDELRPFVDEQRRLEAALEALGEGRRATRSAPSARKPPSARSRARNAAPGKSRKRPPRTAS